MIKNIIFDIGGVIAYFDVDKVLNEFSQDKDLQNFLKDNVINSPEWGKYGLIDLGYISLEDMGNIICDRTNHVHDDLVMKLSTTHVDYLVTQDRVLELITKLRKNGYKVYILSNTNKYAIQEQHRKNLLDYVDGYVLSYQVKKIKPYIGIYKELINKYNLIPSECIFVDDRNENIETANSLGINGINVMKNNYEDLVNSLKKNTINID